MAGQEIAPWEEQPQETAPWEEDQPQQKQPDLGPMKKYISGNLKNWQAAQNVPKGDLNAQQNTDLPGAAPIPGAAPAENPPGQKGPQAANSFLDAVEAGFQMSVTGLVKRGKLPETILPEDAPMAYRLASQAATLAGDVPAMLAGGIGGALAGGALGTAELPVIGTVAGAGVGASAGAWALPAALRTALMDHYKKGDIKSFGDFWERSGGVFMDALKAGTVGAVTGGAGAAAENVLGQTAAPALLQTAGKLGSELATMTTVGKAMDGQVPKAQDFIDGALLLTAFHGVSSLSGELAPHVETAAGKLRDIYAKTGLTPDQVALQAQTNPVLHQEILSSNKEIPSAYESAVEAPGPGSEAIAPPDPAKVEVGSNKALNELAGPLNKDISEPSKVVAEASGKDVKLFHGTNADFDKLDFSKSGGMTFFGEAPDVAKRYAEGGGGQRAKLKESEMYLVNDKGVAHELQGHQEVEKILKTSDGKELPYRQEEGGQWVPVGRFEGDELPQNQANLKPLPEGKEHPPLSREEAQDLTKEGNGSGYLVPKNGRILTQEFKGLHLLDTTTPEGLKEIASLEPKTSLGKAFVRAAQDDLKSGSNGGQFSSNFWSATKFGQAHGEALKTDITDALRAKGYDGIRFNDDQHKTVGLFESAMEKRAGEPQEQTRSDAQQQVLDRIVPSEKQKTTLSFDKAYTAMVDDLHPLKVMTEQLSGENPPPVSKNPYNLMRLSRGAYGKADQFLEHGPFSFESLKQTGTQGLKEILEPFKDDLDGFRAYAVASRTVELNARGIETGVPLEAAKETAKAGREKYEGAFQELGKFQNETLAYLRDSGLLSKDAYQKMEEANRSYVPFFRLQEKGEQIKGAGQGLQVKNPIKGIEGSGSQILDPIESIVKNTYMYVTLAERNRALSALADLAEKNPEAGLMTRIPTPQKPIEVQKEELSKFMAAHGLPPTDDSMTIFRPQSLPLAQDEIALYRDGKREVYQVPQAVADTVKGLDRESSNMLTRWAALPAKLIRVGAVHTPDFLGRHLIRDQFNAFTLSKNGYVPFLDALSGLGSLLKQDDDYQSFLKSGGAISSAVSIDRDYIQSEVFKLSKETGLIDMARNVIKSPLAALQVAAELMSNSTRIGEFKRAAGGQTDPDSIMRAGLASRDVTLDYQRIGAQTRALNSIVAFWNAHLQGMDRMMRAFQEDPAGMTLKVGASITLPSVLLWYANHDDPRYQELPRWQKDLFWIVMTKDHIFRIPKPFEPGVLFGSLPERVLEQFHDKNPSAWKGFGDSVTQGAIPNYMPTFALPALEQWANKSYMTGGSVIPGDLERVLPEYQYNNYTTETGKMLGKMVGALPAIGQMGPEGAKLESPMVVENYIRAWGGGLGRYALQLSDLALTKSGLVPEAPKPASTLSDMPFIKAFTVRYPSAQAQSIQDFHEAYNETQRVIDTVKHLSKTGDYKSVEKMLAVEQNQDSLLNLSETQKAISTQNQMIQNIYRNPDMKPDEKRQLIDTLYYQMIQSARGGLEKVKEFRKAISSRQ